MIFSCAGNTDLFFNQVVEDTIRLLNIHPPVLLLSAISFDIYQHEDAESGLEYAVQMNFSQIADIGSLSEADGIVSDGIGSGGIVSDEIAASPEANG